jgi:hypothetical protein
MHSSFRVRPPDTALVRCKRCRLLQSACRITGVIAFRSSECATPASIAIPAASVGKIQRNNQLLQSASGRRPLDSRRPRVTSHSSATGSAVASAGPGAAGCASTAAATLAAMASKRSAVCGPGAEGGKMRLETGLLPPRDGVSPPPRDGGQEQHTQHISNASQRPGAGATCCCTMLHHAAPCYNVLQRAVTRCNMLQYAASRPSARRGRRRATSSGGRRSWQDGGWWRWPDARRQPARRRAATAAGAATWTLLPARGPFARVGSGRRHGAPCWYSVVALLPLACDAVVGLTAVGVEQGVRQPARHSARGQDGGWG